MEHIEQMLCFILGLWLFITMKNKALFDRRLMAGDRNAVQRHRRALELSRQLTRDARFVELRMRIFHILQTRLNGSFGWTPNRSSEWWDLVVPSFTNSQWLENFRMSEGTFLYLCNIMNLAMERWNTNFRTSVKKRIAIALWKLATGADFRSVGQRFGVGITTVFRCLKDFCAVAEMLLKPEQIPYPDPEKFKQLATDMEELWGLPHCIGAIHDSHIPVLAPPENYWDYLNSQGWHSIIFQGVVDAKGLFWNVFAGLPGSLNVAQVLRLSSLWELCGNRQTYVGNMDMMSSEHYILGDAEYPLQNWLLKPVFDNGRLTEEQHVFNGKVSRARVVVDKAFGRLKGRWSCLLRRNDCEVELVKSMVLTCCALHNLCENQEEPYFENA